MGLASGHFETLDRSSVDVDRFDVRGISGSFDYQEIFDFRDLLRNARGRRVHVIQRRSASAGNHVMHAIAQVVLIVVIVPKKPAVTLYFSNNGISAVMYGSAARPETAEIGPWCAMTKRIFAL